MIIDSVINSMTRKYAVYTSCGDFSFCDQMWNSDTRDYDLLASFYGNDTSRFVELSSIFDFVIREKGSKFQNFYKLYTLSNKLWNYERIFILDDDIIISPSEINAMFEFAEEYNLWICQPSFSSRSKISHEVTRQVPNSHFRYTNFIEVNAPLMNRQAISKLIAYYDPSLIEWGVDFLYTWANSLLSIPATGCKKFAINDSITCTNPTTKNKGYKELSQLPGFELRIQVWMAHAQIIGCPPRWKPSNL